MGKPVRPVHCHDLDIMAQTIFGQARSEPMAVKIAAARTILDLWLDEGTPETISEVCLEKGRFSCWAFDHPGLAELHDVGPYDVDYCEALAAAATVLADDLHAAVRAREVMNEETKDG